MKTFTKDNMQEFRDMVYSKDTITFTLQLPFPNQEGAPHILEVSRMDAIYMVGRGVYNAYVFDDKMYVLSPAIEPTINLDYGFKR